MNRQQPSPMPSHRYRDIFAKVPVAPVDRTWPDRRITQAPLWVPVDLRDGNQALAEPMDPERKRRFFELMVAIGYKEIEVGYPSASQTDFDFVRLLAESDLVPPDVTIVVFTPARKDLIERTVESVAGMRGDVVIHLYAATAPVWRDVVLRKSRDELASMIYAGSEEILRLAGDSVRFQFSPEVYNLTEPDYVLELADHLTKQWDATPQRPVILNLAQAAWVSAHHNVLISGPTGAGKSFIGCALAHAAIRRGHTALYVRTPRLLAELALSRGDGRYVRRLGQLARIGLLVLDDFLLTPPSVIEAKDLLEVIDDRSQLRSTLVVSQLPVENWHPALADGDPTLADAILDRLVHNAHRLTLKGASMRRRQPEEESPVA